MKSTMTSLLLLLVLLAVNIISCLPITSKPIENTPEHLAWEAWIMVPPTENRTRKITPKSIFILPNKTNSQLQCPPDHRIDNFRCIKTVQIDHKEILFNQFASLLNSTSTSYDYDYDYSDTSEIEQPHQPIGQSSNPAPDYNGGPLKIDLLGKLPPLDRDENKQTESFGIISANNDQSEEINVQPFRDEASSSTTISTTIFTESKSARPFSLPSTMEPRTRTTLVPTWFIPNATKFPTLSPSTSTTFSTTSAIPILSSTELEMSTVTSTKITSSIEQEYSEFIEESTSPSTIRDDIDIVTTTHETLTDLKEELTNESFVVQIINNTQTTITNELSESTEPNNDLSTTLQDDIAKNTTNTEDEQSTIAFIKPYSHKFVHQELKSTPDTPKSKDDENGATIQVQDKRAQILQNIDSGGDNSGNRFIYHHLDPSTSSNSKQSQHYSQTTPDVQQQLRIINKIVEENKKRAQLGSHVKFPTDTYIQTDNVRADIIKFPGPSATSRFNQEKLLGSSAIPNRPHSTVATSTAIPKPPETLQNTKPFWWLPSGWEIDRNAEKPLLLRFWSRLPNATSTSSTTRWRSSQGGGIGGDSASAPSTTTSGYRENSRSPTDNLYREISAQDVFKVLGTRNWRHNNR